MSNSDTTPFVLESMAKSVDQWLEWHADQMMKEGFGFDNSTHIRSGTIIFGDRAMFKNWAKLLRDTSTKIDEQAKRIQELDAHCERFISAVKGLSFGTDWNNGTHAKTHGYRQALIDALEETPDQSLAEIKAQAIEEAIQFADSGSPIVGPMIVRLRTYANDLRLQGEKVEEVSGIWVSETESKFTETSEGKLTYVGDKGEKSNGE